MVAIQCLKRCPEEIPDEFWPPDKPKRKSKASQSDANVPKSATEVAEDNTTVITQVADDNLEEDPEEPSPNCNRGKYYGRLCGHPRTADDQEEDL